MNKFIVLKSKEGESDIALPISEIKCIEERGYFIAITLGSNRSLNISKDHHTVQGIVDEINNLPSATF